tara:strand:- start:1586 stop:1807 length:222 start_codon:yes stop_codon:yes gene_type:complete
MKLIGRGRELPSITPLPEGKPDRKRAVVALNYDPTPYGVNLSMDQYTPQASLLYKCMRSNFLTAWHSSLAHCS